MKNYELIKKLLKYNPEADVTLVDSEDITLSYLSDEGGTPMDTLQIFIEGVDKCPICVQEYMGEDGQRWCSFYNKPCKIVEECYQFEEFGDNY